MPVTMMAFVTTIYTPNDYDIVLAVSIMHNLSVCDYSSSFINVNKFHHNKTFGCLEPHIDNH